MPVSLPTFTKRCLVFLNTREERAREPHSGPTGSLPTPVISRVTLLGLVSSTQDARPRKSLCKHRMHVGATGVLKPAHASSGELSGHLSSRFWVQGHQAGSLKLVTGSVCTTEISKCYKARLLLFPPERPLSNTAAHQCIRRWKPSLTCLSLNISI